MKLLLPTDGSEYSETAAQFLTRLNLTANDAITLLHVLGDDPFQDNDDYYYAKIQEVKQLIAPKILESAMNILKSVPAAKHTLLVKGSPDKCIIDAAIASNADLIIMGHKRLKGIKSRIIGSVAKSVSISSPKPVLVIKPSLGGLSRTVKILFATDGSDYARKAGEILTMIPFHDTTEITILHVITPAFHDIPDKYMTTIEGSVKEDLKKFQAEDSQAIFAQTAGYLKKRFSRIHEMTKKGEPSDEILHTANELNADLIVVGSKGMGGFRGIIGSLSRYILSVAECSVLIGKSEGI